MANGPAFYDKDFFVIKQDKELVAESITRILMTNPGERVGQPYFGVGIRNILFNQIDDEITAHLENLIIDQISQYEPRVNILGLDVISLNDENLIRVKLSFVLKGEPPESANILTYNFDLE